MSKRSVDEVELATQVLPAKALLESLIRALSVVEETRLGARRRPQGAMLIAILARAPRARDTEGAKQSRRRRDRSEARSSPVDAHRAARRPDETAANAGPPPIAPASREAAFGKLRKSGLSYSLKDPGQRQRRASVLCDHPRVNPILFTVQHPLWVESIA